MSSTVTALPSTASAPSPDPSSQMDDDRVALNKEAIKHAFLDNLFYIQGKFPALATKTDYYMALAYAVRDRMLQRWIDRRRLHQAGLANGLLLLRRVPHGAASRQQPHQPRHLRHRAPGRHGARPRLRGVAGDGRRTGPRQRRPRPSGGVLPRFARRRSKCRRWATASATTSASSSRKSSTAGRSRRPTSGCGSAIPGRSRDPSGACDVKFGGTPSVCVRRVPSQAQCAGCRAASSTAFPYDTPILGYHDNTANTLRLW